MYDDFIVHVYDMVFRNDGGIDMYQNMHVREDKC